MKNFQEFIIIILIILLPLSLFIISGILAYFKISGWGWFLFIGLLVVADIPVFFRSVNSLKDKNS